MKEKAIQANSSTNSARIIDSRTVTPPTWRTRTSRSSRPRSGIAVPVKMKARRGATSGAKPRSWLRLKPPQRLHRHVHRRFRRKKLRSTEYLPSLERRGLSLRCPSIDPDFRYRFIVLHQRCADFDRGLFLHESSKLSRQPPVAGLGWVTMFWISAFSAVTTPRRMSWDRPISAFRRSSRARRLWRCRLLRRCRFAKIVPGVRASAHPVPNANDRCRCARPWPARAFFGRQKAAILSWISSLVGISISFTAPSPQSPIGSAHRLGRRSKFEFEVLIGGKILLTLHQAETARVEVGKRGDLQIAADYAAAAKAPRPGR